MNNKVKPCSGALQALHSALLCFILPTTIMSPFYRWGNWGPEAEALQQTHGALSMSQNLKLAFWLQSEDPAKQWVSLLNVCWGPPWVTLWTSRRVYRFWPNHFFFRKWTFSRWYVQSRTVSPHLLFKRTQVLESFWWVQEWWTQPGYQESSEDAEQRGDYSAVTVPHRCFQFDIIRSYIWSD